MRLQARWLSWPEHEVILFVGTWKRRELQTQNGFVDQHAGVDMMVIAGDRGTPTALDQRKLAAAVLNKVHTPAEGRTRR
jgi:hypothetical protein